MRNFLSIFFGFSLILAACRGPLPVAPSSPATTTPASQPPATLSAVAPTGSEGTPAGPQPSPAGTVEATASALTPPAVSETIRLLIWVPPFLSSVSENPAGSLLRKRLTEFQDKFPNVIVETRVKAESGPGGLLDSITTASAAAPASLPDLVALPRELEEAAALKGLLLPLDNLTTSLDNPDWYPYALELAHLQNNVYGFPFAGNALVQVYHTDLITDTLRSWASVVQAGQPLLFPAASTNAFFTLASYQAAGGQPRDEQGRPTLTVPELSRVLDFYQQSVQSGVMPVALLTQLQNDQAAWEAFESSQGQIVITWSSRYLQDPGTGKAISQIPGPQGESYTLATGWVWALVGRDEAKRRLAVDLATFLTDSQFLAEWTQSMGYLPPRPSSLALWSDRALAQSVESIATEAVLLPPTDVIAALEVHLQQAALAVLTGQADPDTAAEEASASLTSP